MLVAFLTYLFAPRYANAVRPMSPGRQAAMPRLDARVAAKPPEPDAAEPPAPGDAPPLEAAAKTCRKRRSHRARDVTGPAPVQFQRPPALENILSPALPGRCWRLWPPPPAADPDLRRTAWPAWCNTSAAISSPESFRSSRNGSEAAAAECSRCDAGVRALTRDHNLRHS